MTGAEKRLVMRTRNRVLESSRTLARFSGKEDPTPYSVKIITRETKKKEEAEQELEWLLNKIKGDKK